MLFYTQEEMSFSHRIIFTNVFLLLFQLIQDLKNIKIRCIFLLSFKENLKVSAIDLTILQEPELQAAEVPTFNTG